MTSGDSSVFIIITSPFKVQTHISEDKFKMVAGVPFSAPNLKGFPMNRINKICRYYKVYLH